MKLRDCLVPMSVVALACAGHASAQPRPGDGAALRGNPREAAISRFEAAAPAIGEALPDIVVHDRTGKELRLRELLKERYTVLILGCLT